MPGLVPGIHVLLVGKKTWMAGTSPAIQRKERLMVTKEDTKRYSLDDLAERRTSGRTMTHADAPARAIDDDFWKGARIVMPCPKNKPLRQPT